MNEDDIKVIHEKRLQNGLKISTNTKRSDSKLKNLSVLGIRSPTQPPQLDNSAKP